RIRRQRAGAEGGRVCRRQERRIDVVIELLARPSQLAPVQEVVASEHADAFVQIETDVELHLGHDGEVVVHAATDVRGQGQHAALRLHRGGVGQDGRGVAFHVDLRVRAAQGALELTGHKPAVAGILATQANLDPVEVVGATHAVVGGDGEAVALQG